MSRKITFDKRAIPYLLIFVVVVGFIVYWRIGVEKNPGDYYVKTGNYQLEDGRYEEAIADFAKALAENPDHAMAHLGLAITYMQQERNAEALQEFNGLIEKNPDMAYAYADRGILYDRMGMHREALADYQKAIELDEKILEGPGWLWRFMRNIDKKPPNIKDRAAYLEAELAKPENERLLQVPEMDEKQRMYKIDD